MLPQYQYKSHVSETERLLPQSLEKRLRGGISRVYGFAVLIVLAAVWASLISWSAADPSLTHITSAPPANVLGYPGAILSDLLLESLGLTSILALLAPMFWGTELALSGRIRDLRTKLTFFPLSIFTLASAFASLPPPQVWPMSQGLGGILGDAIYGLCHLILATLISPTIAPVAGAALFAAGFAALAYSIGIELKDISKALKAGLNALTPVTTTVETPQEPSLTERREPSFSSAPFAEPRAEPELESLAPESVDEVEATFTPERPAAPVRKPMARKSRDNDAPTLMRSFDERAPAREQSEDEEIDDLPPSLRPQATEPPVKKSKPSSGSWETDTPTQREPEFDLDTDDDSAAIARRFAPANRQGKGYAAYAEPPTTGKNWEPKKTSRAKSSPTLLSEETSEIEVSDEPTLAPTLMKNASAAARATASPARKLMKSFLHKSSSEDDEVERNRTRSTPAPWEAVPTITPSPIAETISTEEDTRKRRLGSLCYKPSARIGYKRPSVHLLDPAPTGRPGPEFTQTVSRAHARMLKDVLRDFGINGEVREIKQGPVVSLFELEPQRGTKTSRVVALADDIARAMSVPTVRIAAMPGSSAIGIEIPNPRRETVHVREIFESDTYRRFDGPLPIALGKSIEGTPVVADLTRMPHLLVTGQAGSGKTAALNAMIQSIVYRHGPDACRLLLIDPKMIELSNYNDVPHLLAPVVTDPLQGIAALEWIVAEMEERHKRMSKLSVRSIDIFNNRVINAKKRGEMISRTVNTGFDRSTGEPIYEHEQMDLATMPYIVVVIDEFAGIARSASEKFEAAFRRISTMAQQAGIHLVLATEEMSPDVLTDTLIKNLRTKICFKTPTKADSRFVLGGSGAEQLLDRDDMLLSSGSGHCARIHSARVDSHEVQAVAEFLRSAGTADYDADLMARIAGAESEPQPRAPQEDNYARASRPRLSPRWA
ncbi:DNA segregation ATPase FtsK/SpoIIIE, S-DNA-T family [Filomicrobium insigne]|uniref:DNA translocase FtsK n=1 Tax=Filomicrobium insigne TaxID=418854 RepID=A0A1H0TZL2_9HYPH|nr:DNA segregation ATPase FtsK/SpoIIIE, S-DNA-T family [Filomicrobium insigne]